VPVDTVVPADTVVPVDTVTPVDTVPVDTGVATTPIDTVPEDTVAWNEGHDWEGFVAAGCLEDLGYNLQQRATSEESFWTSIHEYNSLINDREFYKTGNTLANRTVVALAEDPVFTNGGSYNCIAFESKSYHDSLTVQFPHTSVTANYFYYYQP
jgi:hypothetical protein